MKWLIENWYLVVAFIVVIFVSGVAIYKWTGKPTEEQIKNIKEWLLYAVTEAEAALGSGTGQLKLKYVYDMAIERFSWLSIIPFETFSGWVDEALEEMREMLKTNKAIALYVEESDLK